MPPSASTASAAGGRELAVKFKVLKFLGKGSYGSVFQVQRLNDGQTYALKEMDVKAMSQAEREDAANEIRLLASVQHPNITSYNEAFLDGNRLCIIMEYAPDGDLAKIIKKHQMLKKPIPESQIWMYFIQIAMGLQALHTSKILHRDIKPGNIMIMADGTAKIGDLGIAKLLTKTLAAKTQIGTPHYMPPEIWRNKPYAYSSDSWALGCLLYEMATNTVPFEARSMSELRYKVLRGTFPPLPSSASRELQQMVKDLLDPNPDRRLTMDQIMSTPAVQSRLHTLPGGLGKAPPSTAASQMLDTIKVPKNFQMIKGKLPPAQYASDMLLNNSGSSKGSYEEENVNRWQPSHAQPKQVVAEAAPPLPKISAAPSRSQSGYNYAPAGQANRRPSQYDLGPGPNIAKRISQYDAGPSPSAAKAAAAASHAGFYNGKPAPIQVAPQMQAYAASLADMHPWQPKQAQSESHAAYGAFYSSPKAAHAGSHLSYQPSNAAYSAQNGYTPTAAQAAAASRWQQPSSPYAAAAKKLQAMQDAKRQPQYDEQPAFGKAGIAAKAGAKLPGQYQYAGRPSGAASPKLNKPKTPPWNYNAGAGKKIASKDAWIANQIAQLQKQAVANGAPRYPPSQWSASPAR